ncbi:MAG: hypothetical protein P8020_02325 [Acidobacteriota bacterium]|jgi:hypothetical protein
MSVRYRIHAALRIVHTVVYDTTDAQELHAYSDQIRKDPAIGGSFNHLIEISTPGPSSDGTLAVQVFFELVPPVFQIKLAVVAPKDVDFGIARQFQSINELTDEIFWVFRNLEEALTWLGFEDRREGWSDWTEIDPG